MPLMVPHHHVESEAASLARRRPTDVSVAHDAEGAAVHLAQGAPAMEVPHALALISASISLMRRKTASVSASAWSLTTSVP